MLERGKPTLSVAGTQSDEKHAPDIIFSTEIPLCGLYHLTESAFSKAALELKNGNATQFQQWLGKNQAAYVIYQNSSKEYVFKYLRKNDDKIECSSAIPLKTVKKGIDTIKSKKDVVQQLLLLAEVSESDRQSIVKQPFYCISETLTEEQLKVISAVFQHSHVPIDKFSDPYYSVKIEERCTKELQYEQPSLDNYKFDFCYKKKPQITITKIESNKNKISNMTLQVLGAIGIPEETKLSLENRQKIKMQLQKHHSYTEADIQNINTVGNIRELLKEYETLASFMSAFMIFVRQSPYSNEEKSAVNKDLIDIYFAACSSVFSKEEVISTRRNVVEIPYTKNNFSLSQQLKIFHLEKYKTYTQEELAEILNIISDFLNSDMFLQFLQVVKKGVYYFAFIDECTHHTFSNLTRKPLQHLGQLVKIGPDSSNGLLDNIFSDFSKFHQQFPNDLLKNALDNFSLVKLKIVEALKDVNVDCPDVLDVAYEHKLLVPEDRKQELFTSQDKDFATTFDAKVKQREERNKNALEKASNAIKDWKSEESKDGLPILANKYFDALLHYTKVSMYGYILNNKNKEAEIDKNNLEKLNKFERTEEFLKKQDVVVALYNAGFFDPKNKKIFEVLIQSIKKETEERVIKLERNITSYLDIKINRVGIIQFLESLSDLYTIQMLESALNGQVKDEVQLQKRTCVINNAIDHIKHLKCGLFLLSHAALLDDDALNESNMFADERSEVYAIVEDQPESNTPQLYHLKKEDNKKILVRQVGFNGSYSVLQLKKDFGEAYHLQGDLSSFPLNTELNDQELETIEFSMIDAKPQGRGGTFIPRQNSYKVELAHILHTLAEEESIKKSRGIGISSGAFAHIQTLINKLNLTKSILLYKASTPVSAKEEKVDDETDIVSTKPYSPVTTIETRLPYPNSSRSSLLPLSPMTASSEKMDEKIHQGKRQNKGFSEMFFDQQQAEQKSKNELFEKIKKGQQDKLDLTFKILKSKKDLLDQEIKKIIMIEDENLQIKSILNEAKEDENKEKHQYEINKSAAEAFAKNLLSIKDNPSCEVEIKEQRLMDLKVTLMAQHNLSNELKELDNRLQAQSNELKPFESELIREKEVFESKTQVKKTALWKYILGGAIVCAGATLIGTGIGAALLGAALVGTLFLSLVGSGTAISLTSLFYSIFRAKKDINLENEVNTRKLGYHAAKIKYDSRKKEVNDLTSLKIEKQNSYRDHLVTEQEQNRDVYAYQASLDIKTAASEAHYSAKKQIREDAEQRLILAAKHKEDQAKIIQKATQDYEKILIPNQGFKKCKISRSPSSSAFFKSQPLPTQERGVEVSEVNKKRLLTRSNSFC